MTRLGIEPMASCTQEKHSTTRSLRCGTTTRDQWKSCKYCLELKYHCFPKSVNVKWPPAPNLFLNGVDGVNISHGIYLNVYLSLLCWRTGLLLLLCINVQKLHNVKVLFTFILVECLCELYELCVFISLRRLKFAACQTHSGYFQRGQSTNTWGRKKCNYLKTHFPRP